MSTYHAILISILLTITLVPYLIDHYVKKAQKRWKQYDDDYEEAYREDAMWEAWMQDEIKEIQNQAILEKEYEDWKLSDEAEWLQRMEGY
jgi:predicted Holliday junction resolvase-like endonuclease|tara:strand:- start:985 stop:1254 length:270 start_codon:yes stop_codon:yes gene_type:complete